VSAGLGTSASWPDLQRGKSIFTRYAPLRMHDLKQPRTLEVIPNLNYSLRQTRETPAQWGEYDSKPDAGFTVKYGHHLLRDPRRDIPARLHPRVESDTFQA